MRDVEKWTNQLFQYSQLLTLTEEDKEIVIEALQNYYSEEQASWLFNTYFEQESDGTYILIPQDAFGAISHIQFSLQVDIAEADDRYHIEMVGSFSDSLEEVMEMQVVEKVTILKDTLQIDSVEARIE
ncbi:hypothetical protein [Rubeoparvulum massiliense]|uniref:hypothetical protein n=1 Tax=Rubeoparvulum massiliense TaxID=1631346 RepID=UPI0011C7DCB3|nr:hypothetical protein [Rubeoparvulum massiliense]